MSQICFHYALLALLGSILAGCGGKDMAAVHGNVTHRSETVTSGALVFSPIPADKSVRPGKSATGDIQPDGTFQLSTHQLHDGAVVGRHRVRYIPSLDDEKKSAGGPLKDFTRLALPTDYEVEVKSGEDNEIQIELVERSPK